MFSKLDFLEKSEVTSSEPNDYMGRIGKGLTNFLNLRTKRPKNKQRTWYFIIDITNQDFMKLLKKFNNSPNLG